MIKIKAKRNTKGIAINGIEVGVYRRQGEWLLNENQKYITNEVDEKIELLK